MSEQLTNRRKVRRTVFRVNIVLGAIAFGAGIIPDRAFAGIPEPDVLFYGAMQWTGYCMINVVYCLETVIKAITS